MANETRNVPLEVNFIITIVINSISCPFTVLLNVLVIMAVKRRPRLQTNANILLACLAATDVFTGLVSQPSFILWKTFRLLDVLVPTNEMFRHIQTSSLRLGGLCSCLHLMLVTGERLLAIKFTWYYPYLMTKQNIKLAVISFWILAISFAVVRLLKIELRLMSFLLAFVIIFCLVFFASAYIILYIETLRHQKLIKTQQLPQDEVERFVKENKALKTTVLVVGAVIVCFIPSIVVFSLQVLGVINTGQNSFYIFSMWTRSFLMLNSLLNPLIYCYRRNREMRMFVFRISTQAVHPANCKRKTSVSRTLLSIWMSIYFKPRKAAVQRTKGPVF